jgi:hypothetical protein
VIPKTITRIYTIGLSRKGGCGGKIESTKQSRRYSKLTDELERAHQIDAR